MMPAGNMDRPLVSILIVVRNGSRDIIGALESIRQQDYAPLEVLVVDGRSSDDTRALVETYGRRELPFPIRLLDNPRLIQASGWNVGIRAANGEYILRLDAVHCRLDPDYVRCCLEKLLELRQTDSTVAAVGGQRVSASTTTDSWAQAIALAQTSRFGVGNATYRLGATPGYTDTLGVPLYCRSILLQVGLFDESLGRSEDNELHTRLRKNGFKLFFYPATTATYHPRTTLGSVASQMFHNGRWVSKTVILLRSFPFGLRHIVPFGFYVVLIIAGLLGLAGIFPARVLFCALLGTYAAGSIAAAVYTRPSRQFWRVAIVFFLMHSCYAAGTMSGFFGARTGAVAEASARGVSLGS
ncbi:MAG TPA: glycosyltransferase family 2 protein [Terriglobales bacterium]|nr:glycosyltransferase family 2 protein [Terriglobales bacterium]